MNRTALIAFTSLLALGTVDAFACGMRVSKRTNLFAKTLIKKAEKASNAGYTIKARRLFERASFAKGSSAQRSYAATKAATIYAAQKRTSRALSLSRRAVRLSPENGTAHSLLGRLLIDRHPTRAAIHLKRAIATMKTVPLGTHIDLIRALTKSGQHQAARTVHGQLAREGMTIEQHATLARALSDKMMVAQAK